MSGFEIFKRRRLDRRENRPTRAALAAELRCSRQLVNAKEAAMQAALVERMRDRDWRIRIAVDDLKDRLGELARPGELHQAFMELDPGGNALSDELPHRRTLLLQVGGYRISEDWILGPDVEKLTDVVLQALANSESAHLDSVGGHLSRLGIREELHLPWIVGRHGFRIIGGELLRFED